MINKTKPPPIAPQQSPDERDVNTERMKSCRPDDYDSFWAGLFALASKPLTPNTNSSSVLISDSRNALQH